MHIWNQFIRQRHIEAVWETGIPVWAPKKQFSSFFFQFCFNIKYVEVVISDFTLHLIIWKWLRRQKCGQKREKMKPKDVEAKEETVYESDFIHLNM